MMKLLVGNVALVEEKGEITVLCSFNRQIISANMINNFYITQILLLTLKKVDS